MFCPAVFFDRNVGVLRAAERDWPPSKSISLIECNGIEPTRIAVRNRIIIIPHVAALRHGVVDVAFVGIRRRPLLRAGVV